MFQVENGDCIGGYADISWSMRGYIRDDRAKLFNLTSKRYYPAKKSGFINSSMGYGPTFTAAGFGVELGATGIPFNGKRKCLSYANFTSF